MTSERNKKGVPLKPLRWYKNLATHKGRLESGAFLIEGERALDQIISRYPDQIIEILSGHQSTAIDSSYPVRCMTESQIRSIAQTKTPQGSIAVVRIPSNLYSDELPEETGNRILLLEDVQDPGNVGTLIRTAVAFGFSGAILTEKCADPLTPKCVQATAGTILSIWIRKTSRYLALIEGLKKANYALVSGDPKGVDDISILPRTDRCILALGNEAAGLSQSILDKSDLRVRISMDSTKVASLNVAAAGAICMYFISRGD